MTQTNNAALILIDWQKGFSDLAYWGNRNNPAAEENSAKLLTHWRENGWPVIHVRHNSTTQGSRLHPNHPGHGFVDFAVPRDGEPVYGKTVNSAFIGTMLEGDLRASGINRIVLCGVSTDHCVNTSARMGGNLGFDVTIVGDACHTFDRSLPDGRVFAAELVHDVALASLNEEFAAVKMTRQVITG